MLIDTISLWHQIQKIAKFSTEYRDIATVLRPFFRDHPGEPVPEENFWTWWCKGRLTEAVTLTIRLGATPSGLTSAHLHHPPNIFYRPDALPAAQPTASIKAQTLVRLVVSLTSIFSTNMAISERKGHRWRVILTRWRKASNILTSTLAAFFV